MALPLVGFAALGRAVLVRLARRRSVENPLRPDRPAGAANRAAAAATASSIDGAPVPGLDPAVFKGKVSVVNVWASWCVPCHDEAPLLTQLGQDKRLQLVGINYKDAPDNARRFLGRYGNPFGIVGVDGNGRAAIEWGVYGVPETFIVGRDGTIVYKTGRPGHAGQYRHRAQGRDRQGARRWVLIQFVIASASEAIQRPHMEPWIASSQELLATTINPCSRPPLRPRWPPAIAGSR